MASSDYALRRRALTRAYFLYANNWLNSEEQATLSVTIWKQIAQETGLPKLDDPVLVLYLPQPKEHDATGTLKKALLGKVLEPWQKERGINLAQVRSTGIWLNQLVRVFRHRAVAEVGEIILPLNTEEAAGLLGQLLTWWSSAIDELMSPEIRSSPLGGREIDEIVDEFCILLGESLLLYLPRGHDLVTPVEQQITRLISEGASVARATPGRLFHRAEILPEIVIAFERALLSENGASVRSSANAIVSWQRVASASLVPPVPISLVNLLIARVAVRQMAALDSVINCLAHLIAVDALLVDQQQEELLILALEQLADETSAKHLRARFTRGEIERAAVVENLHIHGWAGFLASKMSAMFAKRGMALPKVLERWRTICENDPLPETRRAWRAPK